MSKPRTFVLLLVMLCGTPIAACAPGGAGRPVASDPNAVVSSPFASCTFFFRDAQGGPEQRATLTVSRGKEGMDRQASATLGDFRMRVSEGSEHPHVSGNISVWVGAKTAPENEWLGHTLYQLGPQNRSLGQEMEGGHGFTGLHHVRHPQSGTELQWLCTKAPHTK